MYLDPGDPKSWKMVVPNPFSGEDLEYTVVALTPWGRVGIRCLASMTMFLIEVPSQTYYKVVFRLPESKWDRSSLAKTRITWKATTHGVSRDDVLREAITALGGGSHLSLYKNPHTGEVPEWASLRISQNFPGATTPLLKREAAAELRKKAAALIGEAAALLDRAAAMDD